jgi:hypothetical protein
VIDHVMCEVRACQTAFYTKTIATADSKKVLALRKRSVCPATD